MNDADWGPAERGALRSVLTNRQWPQARVCADGWSTHDRCIACVQRAIEMQQFGTTAPLSEWVAAETAGFKEVDAGEDILQAAPAGTLHHRNWMCPSTEHERRLQGPSEDLFRARAGIGIGQAAWERALVPRPV